MGCAPVARARPSTIRRVNSRPVATTVEQTVEGAFSKQAARPSILKNGNGVLAPLSKITGRSNSISGKAPAVTFTSLPPKVLGSDQTTDTMHEQQIMFIEPRGAEQQQQDFPQVQMTTSVTPRVTMQSQLPQQQAPPPNQQNNLFFSFQEPMVLSPEALRLTGRNPKPSQTSIDGAYSNTGLSQHTPRESLQRTTDPQQWSDQQNQQQTMHASSMQHTSTVQQQYGSQAQPRILVTGQPTRQHYSQVVQLTHSVRDGYSLPTRPRNFAFPQSR